jgi:hypothetical protein
MSRARNAGPQGPPEVEAARTGKAEPGNRRSRNQPDPMRRASRCWHPRCDGTRGALTCITAVALLNTPGKAIAQTQPERVARTGRCRESRHEGQEGRVIPHQKWWNAARSKVPRGPGRVSVPRSRRAVAKANVPTTSIGSSPHGMHPVGLVTGRGPCGGARSETSTLGNEQCAEHDAVAFASAAGRHAPR